ncbi:MAG: rod shape-determining protein RodA [Kiritimatiellae bacterium]|nr:rod shape-determining protein RodA [Kiritimatiellia bacterium]
MEPWYKKLWEKVKRLNWVLLAASLILATAGVLFVKSACSARATVKLQTLWVGQLEFVFWGVLLMFCLAFWDYRKWMKWSPWVYLGILGALVLVLIPGIGVARMGARRWLFGLQPSEPAKLAVMMILAWLLGDKIDRFRSFKGLCLCGLLAGLPAALILLEPDLGTALVLGPTVLAMLFAARITPKILGFGVLALVLIVSYELTLVKIAKAEGVPKERSEQILKWTGLLPHQIDRVETFLYPMRDPYKTGYNARQSEIAVGSGGAWGKGYGRGVQHRLGYLPAAVSMNDFIFPVVAEETGFAGSALLLGIYLFGILLPGVYIGLQCEDNIGKLLCIGVVTLLFCHIFINIGMTVRIVPITGLPLPFISQGGTFMLVMMMAMGFLQSVAIHGRSTDAVFRQ